MIDISNLNPLFIQIPILLILALGIISGFKDGIVKKLLDVVFLICSIILMVFIVPPIANKLSESGFIQNFINSQFSGEMATLLSSLLVGPVYMVITGAGILLIYWLVKFIISFIINRLFKKNIFTRIFGAIWQFALNFAFVAVLMVVIASPSIFKGGEQLLTSTNGVKQVYGGVVKIQETLKKNNLPYSLESVFSKMLAGKDATSEDLARYQSTLERIPSLLDSLNDGSIVNEIMNEDGTVNQNKANQLVDDVIVLSEMVDKLPESQKDKLTKPLENILNESKDQLLDENGLPKETIKVTEEQSNSLFTVIDNLGIDKTLVDELKVLIEVRK